jgi:hypothetical protein
MPSVVNSIDLIYPGNGATGVPLNSSIQVTFNTEIDEWSIEHGGFVLEGPDSDEVIYPGYTPTVLVQGTESQILGSPGLKGIVPGVFTFQRVAVSTFDLVNTSDTTGDGGLYRTRMIFTPTNQMARLIDYKIYLMGDDDITDENFTGIRTKTVFDKVVGANTGDGDLTFSGTYTGSVSEDTFNVRISKAGVPGVAEYEVWKDSAPLNLMGPYLTSHTESPLFDGVTVQFLEGTFDLDDEFSVLVKTPVFLTGTSIVEFTAGGGSISVVPDDVSASVTGNPSLLLSDEFKVLSVTPEDHESNLSPDSIRRIEIKFSQAIDPTSITTGSVQVLTEPVIDHPLLSFAGTTGPISNTVTVSGLSLFIDI